MNYATFWNGFHKKIEKNPWVQVLFNDTKYNQWMRSNTRNYVLPLKPDSFIIPYGFVAYLDMQKGELSVATSFNVTRKYVDIIVSYFLNKIEELEERLEHDLNVSDTSKSVIRMSYIEKIDFDPDKVEEYYDWYITVAMKMHSAFEGLRTENNYFPERGTEETISNEASIRKDQFIQWLRKEKFMEKIINQYLDVLEYYDSLLKQKGNYSVYFVDEIDEFDDLLSEVGGLRRRPLDARVRKYYEKFLNKLICKVSIEEDNNEYNSELNVTDESKKAQNSEGKFIVKRTSMPIESILDEYLKWLGTRKVTESDSDIYYQVIKLYENESVQSGFGSLIKRGDRNTLRSVERKCDIKPTDISKKAWEYYFAFLDAESGSARDSSDSKDENVKKPSDQHANIHNLNKEEHNERTIFLKKLKEYGIESEEELLELIEYKRQKESIRYIVENSPDETNNSDNFIFESNCILQKENQESCGIETENYLDQDEELNNDISEHEESIDSDDLDVISDDVIPESIESEEDEIVVTADDEWHEDTNDENDGNRVEDPEIINREQNNTMPAQEVDERTEDSLDKRNEKDYKADEIEDQRLEACESDMVTDISENETISIDSKKSIDEDNNKEISDIENTNTSLCAEKKKEEFCEWLRADKFLDKVINHYIEIINDVGNNTGINLFAITDRSELEEYVSYRNKVGKPLERTINMYYMRFWNNETQKKDLTEVSKEDELSTEEQFKIKSELNPQWIWETLVLKFEDNAEFASKIRKRKAWEKIYYNLSTNDGFSKMVVDYNKKRNRLEVSLYFSENRESFDHLYAKREEIKKNEHIELSYEVRSDRAQGIYIKRYDILSECDQEYVNGLVNWIQNTSLILININEKYGQR